MKEKSKKAITTLKLAECFRPFSIFTALYPVNERALHDDLLEKFKSYNYPMTNSGIIFYDLGHSVKKEGILIRSEAEMVYINKLETIMKFQNFGNTSTFTVYRMIKINGWESNFGTTEDEILSKIKSLIKFPIELEYFQNYNAVINSCIEYGKNLLQRQGSE
jgi:hypothetical protein